MMVTKLSKYVDFAGICNDLPTLVQIQTSMEIINMAQISIMFFCVLWLVVPSDQMKHTPRHLGPSILTGKRNRD